MIARRREVIPNKNSIGETPGRGRVPPCANPSQPGPCFTPAQEIAAARLYAARVFLFRILTVKNSMKRRATSPAPAINAGKSGLRPEFSMTASSFMCFFPPQRKRGAW